MDNFELHFLPIVHNIMVGNTMASSCRWSSGGLKCPGSEQDKCTSGGSGHSCWCRVAFLILQFLSRKKNALNKRNHRNFIICTFTKAWLIKHMLYELFPCMWKGFILWYFFFSLKSSEKDYCYLVWFLRMHVFLSMNVPKAPIQIAPPLRTCTKCCKVLSEKRPFSGNEMVKQHYIWASYFKLLIVRI